MKYTCEIEIDRPLDKVIELFDNAENLKEWQPGLQSFEHVSGELGQPGAKSKLRYKHGKREFDMIETIIVRDLPGEFSGTYETDGSRATIKNHFQKINDGQTKWICESEFELTNFMMKIVAFLAPGPFKKQTLKFLNQFKTFAEGQS